MKNKRSVLLACSVLLLLACSCPLVTQAAVPTQTPLPTVTEFFVPTQASATLEPALTPTATVSPTPTLSPTPSSPQVTPVSVNVNCRSGPDVAYEAISVLMLGDSSQVTGRNDDSTWWYIHDPTKPGSYCWVAASVVTKSGSFAGLPVIAAEAIVTSVTVDVALPGTVYCGGPNALGFSGTITTNGATKVKFQWEVTGDKTNAPSPETIDFSDADTKDAPNPGAYSVDCGNYNITLHVLSPNNISATKKFKVEAP